MRIAAVKIVRRIFLAVVGACFWLMLGLAITVLVSWSLAAFLPQSGWKMVEIDDDKVLDRKLQCLVGLREYTTTGAVRRGWHVSWFGANSWWVFHNAINRPIDDSLHVPHSRGFSFPRWGNAERVFTDPGRWEEGCEHATGWPLPALWYTIGLDRQTSRNYYVRGGILIARPAGWSVYEIRALPFQPIWAGLAINSLVYAPLAWGCWRGCIAARRLLRRRRGLCPFCAYDLRHDFAAGCPECGWNREAVK